jgi:hypothetical protein
MPFPRLEASMPEAESLQVGDRVMIDGIEGGGGPATITGLRDSPTNRYQVLLDDRSQPAFWAHDFEVSPLAQESPRVDSRIATYEHIHTVQGLLARVIAELSRRQLEHDRSKLASPEVEAFDEWTPKLAASTYGSDEYKAMLVAMKPAIDHHYAANSHHPEHFGYQECNWCFHQFPKDYVGDCYVCGQGKCEFRTDVAGMSLFDLIEMLCDWKAATLRHDDGDIRRSIEINQKRFGYSNDLKRIFLNTLPAIEG